MATDERDERTRLLHRIRRLEGQVRGLHRMVEEDRPCHEVLALCSGIRSAVDATADRVLERYVRECQEDSLREPEALSAMIRAVRLARR